MNEVAGVGHHEHSVSVGHHKHHHQCRPASTTKDWNSESNDTEAKQSTIASKPLKNLHLLALLLASDIKFSRRRDRERKREQYLKESSSMDAQPGHHVHPLST